ARLVARAFAHASLLLVWDPLSRAKGSLSGSGAEQDAGRLGGLEGVRLVARDHIRVEERLRYPGEEVGERVEVERRVERVGLDLPFEEVAVHLDQPPLQRAALGGQDPERELGVLLDEPSQRSES